MTTASVVFYNNPIDEIIKVLDSLESSSVEKTFIIDHSDSNYIEAIASNYSKVIYKAFPNRGFGTGHNHAIEWAILENSDYHAIINPDIYWKGDIISSLSDFMDKNPDCGLVMPKILFPDGKIQYLCKLLPSPMDLFVRRFVPLKNYKERLNNRYELRWTGYDKLMEIPCLSGCFMFVRTSVLKQVGGFDERFFLYAEDMDLCRRIGSVSKTVFNPSIEVFHSFHRASYRSVRYLKMHISSLVKYFNKWGWFFDNTRRKRNKECIGNLNSCKHK